MKKIIPLILASLILLSAVSCGKAKEPQDTSHTVDFIAMDTFFTLRMGDLEEGADADDIFDGCKALVEDIDVLLSSHREDSEVFALNGDIDVLIDADPALTELLSFAAELSDITGGAFDPTLGALTELWNVKGGGPVPSDAAIAEAMALCGLEKFSVEDGDIKKTVTGAKLDLGGIGKGYVAQRLTEYLFECGASYGIVSAGRTVGVFGEKPDGTTFRIGIANPSDPDGVVGYLNISGGFVSVAGDYENYFTQDGVRYHHILDPETGRPSDSGISSVAVLSQNGAAADALSTALMVMGYDAAIELYSSNAIAFEAVFITTSGEVILTDGLDGEKFELAEGAVMYSDTEIPKGSSDTDVDFDGTHTADSAAE